MNVTLAVQSLLVEAVRDATGNFVVSPTTQAALTETAKVIISQTNNEPWYQSRVTWGAIAAILSGLGAAAGLLAAGDWSPELWLTALGSVGGGLATLWGRWIAKKPLGK